MYIHNDTLWPQSDQFGDTGIPFRPVIGLYLVVFIGLYLVVFIGLYLVVHLNWVSIFLGFHALGGYTQRHCPDQFGDPAAFPIVDRAASGTRTRSCRPSTWSWSFWYSYTELR